MAANHRKTVPREELEAERQRIIDALKHGGPRKVEDLVLAEQLEQIDEEIDNHY